MSSKQRICLATAAALLPLVPTSAMAQKDTRKGGAQQKPNVIVIVADDLGFADIGVNGLKDIRTPNIDAIAAKGVRFTNGYVSCPVCSPTRAGLLTGRYQQRFGHEFNPGPTGYTETFGLPLTETTFADRMKKLGYTTGMFGKWHQGSEPKYHPMSRGFDEFFGFLGGAHSYLETSGPANNRILRGREEITQEPGFYTTEAFGREAVKFVEKHAGKPFFIYLPFNAVHTPMQALDKYLSRYPDIKDPKRRTFAGMLSAMDDAIGGVMEALRKNKIEDNTLVFFIADNGGPTNGNTSLNTPFRGYKGQVLEGGIHIAFLMKWPQRVPAGKTYDKPVIALDILPTAVAAAGGKIESDKPIDGVNLLPYVRGRSQGDPHKNLYWRFGQQAAIRSGDWKLVMQDNQTSQLYNLSTDPGEAKDLAEQNPGKASELLKSYQEWNAQLAKPLWLPAKRKQEKFRRLTDEMDDEPTDEEATVEQSNAQKQQTGDAGKATQGSDKKARKAKKKEAKQQPATQQ